MTPTDINGAPIGTGDIVELCEIPTALIQGLPDDDVRDIEVQVGATLEVMGFDRFGNAELQFQSSADTWHTIFVQCQCLRKIN